MAIKREIEVYLKKISSYYEVITLTGPRQSGKTTLVKNFFKNKSYVNLENPSEREFAQQDPESFLAQFPQGAIIDEIQRVPILLSYIQTIVDKEKQKSMFVLTGSQNFALIEGISQSLAGRTGLVKLLPFSCNEIKKSYNADVFAIEQLIFKGFYPKIYEENLDPQIALDDYIQTYLERDLRDWAQIKDLGLFRKFLRMCATRVGQVLNMNNISEDLGVSQPTVKSWINLLELSYVIFLLPSYHANINKQLVKSPKLYFYDVGIASLLLDIKDPKQITDHSMKGSLYENLVVIEALKNYYNKGIRPSMYFYRDKHREVDLVFKEAENLTPVEIKSASTINHDFFKNLDYFEKVFPENTADKILVCNIKKEQRRKEYLITNHQGLLKVL